VYSAHKQGRKEYYYKVISRLESEAIVTWRFKNQVC
jgi:hypothetical protein